MKILCIGDVVGSAGRKAVCQQVPKLRAERGIEFVVANGENLAGGIGVTGPTADELFSAKVDALTGGNHTWKHKEALSYLEKQPRILRPLNYPPGTPGRGFALFDSPSGKIAVISLLARIFMEPVECPFRAVDRALEEIGTRVKLIVVDIHGEATSEKRAMGWHLDGRATVVFGSHTHVPTADEEILPGGTAYQTDTGMTGPYRSVIGMKREPVLKKFLTQRPASFQPAKDDVQLRGLVVDANESTGRATKVERIKISIDS